MAKVTIEDISNLTGLSRGTVSRALNNRPDISSITKERVLEACRELGYTPSHAARSLATGRSDAVAVVVDNLRSRFAADYVRGVLAAAAPLRFVVHVASLDDQAGTVFDALTGFVGERVDSVLVAAPVADSSYERVAAFARARPTVGFASADDAPFDQLSPDFRESGRLIAQHLLSRSRDAFLYLYDGSASHERTQAEGAREACLSAGIDAAGALIDVGPAGGPRLDQVADRLRSAHAIATGSDGLAIEVVIRCLADGRALGRDFVVAGQGNEGTTLLSTPPFASTDYCGEEIGRRAFTLAHERLTKSRHDAPNRTLVTPRLIDRG